jgi:hypothetical protein
LSRRDLTLAQRSVFLTTVIPAKAGIHSYGNAMPDAWTPASAGVTTKNEG